MCSAAGVRICCYVFVTVRLVLLLGRCCSCCCPVGFFSFFYAPVSTAVVCTINLAHQRVHTLTSAVRTVVPFVQQTISRWIQQQQQCRSTIFMGACIADKRRSSNVQKAILEYTLVTFWLVGGWSYYIVAEFCSSCHGREAD